MLYSDTSYVWGCDSVSVPRDSEHAIAAGFNDEFMFAILDSATRNDVLDASVTAVPSSNALEGRAVGSEDHGLAVGIKLNYATSQDLTLQER